MGVTKNLCIPHILGILLLMVAAIIAAPTGAMAQEGASPGLADNETTVWLLDGPTLDKATIEQVRTGLEDSLRGEKGKHVLGDEAFSAYVQNRRPAAPACLYGVGPCVSAESLAFDALDVALVIHVKIRKVGGNFEAAYRLIDRRGAPDSDRVVRGTSARDLAIALVREIYNATGLVAFSTSPVGAKVIIDGAVVGNTPMEYRLPIGRHRYSLQLEKYQHAEGVIEVTSKEKSSLQVGLTLRPGILVLEDIPPGALVYIDGKPEPINASQPIELPPGDYRYEVKADGYTTIKDNVRIEPGLSVKRPVTMVRLNPLLREISPDVIVYNRYMFRVNFAQTFQRTSFRGARSERTDNGELIVRQFTPEPGETTTDPRRFFATRGLRLDFEYYWRYFGLGLLSLSYLRDGNREYQTVVEDLSTGVERDVTAIQLDRLQIRPFQITGRYLYRNIVPSATLGLGLNFQWLALQEVGATNPDEAFSLRQTEAFWALEMGVQYFVTPNWFASFRYNFHDHFNLGVGTEHALTFGVGGAFPNIFGFEPEPPDQL